MNEAIDKELLYQIFRRMSHLSASEFLDLMQSYGIEISDNGGFETSHPEKLVEFFLKYG